MGKYTIVIETNSTDAMQAVKAAGKIGTEIGKLGGEVLYFEAGDLRETVTVPGPTEAEIAEEQTLNSSGTMFTTHGPTTSEEEAAFNAMSSNSSPSPPKPHVEPEKNAQGFICKVCDTRNIMTGTALGAEVQAICTKCKTSQPVTVVKI